MALARYRLHIGLAIYCIFFPFSIFGDWNRDFFDTSLFLQTSFECFQNPLNQHLFHICALQEVGANLRHDQMFMQEIASLNRKSKKNYFIDQVVVKKRPKDNLNELFFWEISLLLNLNEFVVPSVPFELMGKKLIIQKLESLQHGRYLDAFPNALIAKVPLVTYYAVHLLTYVLGAGDLSGMNLGLTNDGNIRLYDNENVFQTRVAPYRTDYSFFVPFVSVAFDWPHYRISLDLSTTQILNQLKETLYEKKEDILLYSTLRQLPTEKTQAILNRLEYLHGFQFVVGESFVDFVHYLYPSLADGLDELAAIVSQILKRRVDHGVALFFTTRMIKPHKVTPQQKLTLDQWIERYF